MVVYWCADQAFQTHPLTDTFPAAKWGTISAVIRCFNTETERTQNTRIRGIYHEFMTVENWNPHGLHLQPQGFDLRHELLWILTGLMIWTLDLWVQRYREFIGFHRKKHRANQKTNQKTQIKEQKQNNKKQKENTTPTKQKRKKKKQQKLRKNAVFCCFFLVTLPVELFFGDSVFDFFFIFC